MITCTIVYPTRLLHSLSISTLLSVEVKFGGSAPDNKHAVLGSNPVYHPNLLGHANLFPGCLTICDGLATSGCLLMDGRGKKHKI